VQSKVLSLHMGCKRMALASGALQRKYTMAVQNEVGSSEQVATQVATSTGTSGGSAGNNTTTGGAGAVPSATAVVAPKGFRLALQQMLQGWQELIPSDSTLLSSAGSLTEAGVLAKLQGYLGAYTDLDGYATGTRQARAQVESQMAEVRQYYAALKAAVISYFGVKSPQLVKFGLKPRKTPAPLSSKQLAVRAAKLSATRALRGTKGSVQKAAIKSGPMAVSVGPVTQGVAVDQLPTQASTEASTTAPPPAALSPPEPAPSGASQGSTGK
jgi:hypothetical protein